MQPELLISSKKATATVLIVDDDEGVRRVLSRWVSDLGYQVRVAASAEAALEEMRPGGVDVALCDVKMPGHDGIWLVDQLRRNHPATSIVMATGMTELDPMVTLRPGVVGYIVKPFDRQELEAALQRGLDARLQQAEAGGSRSLLTDGRPSAGLPEGGADPLGMDGLGDIVDGIILARDRP